MITFKAGHDDVGMWYKVVMLGENEVKRLLFDRSARQTSRSAQNKVRIVRCDLERKSTEKQSRGHMSSCKLLLPRLLIGAKLDNAATPTLQTPN